MTCRFFSTVASLVAGHAVIGLLFWLFLQVPESNVFMLATSGLLVLAILLLVGHVQMFVVAYAQPDTSFRSALDVGVRRASLVVAPLAVLALAWWLTAAAGGWHTRHAGEIDAWIIARTGWTRTSGLHAGLWWLLAFLRFGVGVSLAVALLAAVTMRGVRAAVSGAWVRRGLGWSQLAITTAALLVGLWLPWKAVYWQPGFLPPTWVEPGFAAVKLIVLFLIANLAWAVILWTAARQARRDQIGVGRDD